MGGGLHTRRFENFRTISSGKKKKNPLVLTLGSPSKKGEKKKPWFNPGQPAGKGRERKTLVLPWAARRKRWGKKKKKTLVLTLGSPPEKGQKKKKEKKEVLSVCPSRS
jgi:hypothetical protein